MTIDIAAALNFEGDISGDVLRPMLKRVEGDDADRVVELPRRQIGNGGFEVRNARVRRRGRPLDRPSGHCDPARLTGSSLFWAHATPQTQRTTPENLSGKSGIAPAKNAPAPPLLIDPELLLNRSILTF